MCSCDRPSDPPKAGSARHEPPTIKPQQDAVLAGELSFPSDYLPKDMKVCIENVSTKRSSCNAQIKEQDGGWAYEFHVPPGRYEVWAETGEWPGYRAYYSAAVKCGLTVECTSHKPIIIQLSGGERLTSINPQDWYADGAAANALPEDAPQSPPPTVDSDNRGFLRLTCLLPANGPKIGLGVCLRFAGSLTLQVGGSIRTYTYRGTDRDPYNINNIYRAYGTSDLSAIEVPIDPASFYILAAHGEETPQSYFKLEMLDSARNVVTWRTGPSVLDCAGEQFDSQCRLPVNRSYP